MAGYDETEMVLYPPSKLSTKIMTKVLLEWDKENLGYGVFEDSNGFQWEIHPAVIPKDKNTTPWELLVSNMNFKNSRWNYTFRLGESLGIDKFGYYDDYMDRKESVFYITPHMGG